MAKRRRSPAGGQIEAVVVMLFGLIGAGCQQNSAAPSPAAPLPPVQVANSKVIKALAEPTEMDFVETPLQDLVEALKIRHGIEIQLDTEATATVGVNRDTPITFKINGVSLNSALRQMLQPLKLSYVIDNGLLITTAAKAKELDR